MREARKELGTWGSDPLVLLVGVRERASSGHHRCHLCAMKAGVASRPWSVADLLAA